MISQQFLHHIACVQTIHSIQDEKSLAHLGQSRKKQRLDHQKNAEVLLEKAQSLNLKNSTKFIARKYLDILTEAKPVSCSFLDIATCLMTAVKFNEVGRASYSNDLGFCLKQLKEKFTPQEILQCETDLLKAPGFSSSFTTPYDFILDQGVFPHAKDSIGALTTILDFCLTVPKLMCATSEGLFFGCLFYYCNHNNKVSSDFYSTIKDRTSKQEQGIWVFHIIETAIQSALHS